MKSLRKHSSQRGAALVTALVLLTIVTLLAITSMSTNTLEERMALNSQEMNRVFQAAESALAFVFGENAAFNTANSVNDGGTPFNPDDDVYVFAAAPGETIATYIDLDYYSVFRQKTIPKRGSGWDTNTAFYHFDMMGEGFSTTGVSTKVHAGAYQVGQK